MLFESMFLPHLLTMNPQQQLSLKAQAHSAIPSATRNQYLPPTLTSATQPNTWQLQLNSMKEPGVFLEQMRAVGRQLRLSVKHHN
jgi:hypothetical protein